MFELPTKASLERARQARQALEGTDWNRPRPIKPKAGVLRVRAVELSTRSLVVGSIEFEVTWDGSMDGAAARGLPLERGEMDRSAPTGTAGSLLRLRGVWS